MSRSAFAELIPAYVVPKAALAHRVCLCLYHENVNLLLKSLDKYVGGKVCSSLQAFTDSLVCSPINEECMFSACPLCEKNFGQKIREKLSSGDSKISYCQWVNENGRAEKKEFSQTVKQVVTLLESKVEQYLFRVYVKRKQAQHFEQLKSETTVEKICIQVDFAENFGLKEQDEIQSAHWNTKTISIFTAFVWTANETFSFALPSMDLTHDKFVVDSALKIILDHLKTSLPNLKEVAFFSDGAASQFKQRFHFRNLMIISHEHQLTLTWNFFATSHGKGVVDGIGGTVKRLVWSAVLGGESCRSADEFVKIARQKTKKILLAEITKTAIDSSKMKLENIFKVAKAVPDTLKTHSVTVIDKNTIECRYYSTRFTKKTIKY